MAKIGKGKFSFMLDLNKLVLRVIEMLKGLCSNPDEKSSKEETKIHSSSAKGTYYIDMDYCTCMAGLRIISSSKHSN